MAGFRAGRLLGFRIRIDYSWFVVLVLVTWTFASWQFPAEIPGLGRTVYLAMGLSGALLLFLSVLLHELAHSVVARSRGIEVAGITLFIFGGVAEMRQEPERPLDEFLLTIVGPLSSLALAAAFLALAYLLRAIGAESVAVVSGTLATLNLVLAVFNMVPAFPLDGGRVLRSILWKITGDAGRATKWSAWIGRGFGWLLIAYGVFLFLSGLQLAGVWGVLLGWFLTGAATSAARQAELRQSLTGIPIARALAGPTVFVEADISAEDLVEEYFLRLPATVFPVVQGGRVVGVVGVSDISGLSIDERPLTPLHRIMQPIGEVPAVEHDRPLVEILIGMRGASHDRVLVVSEGELLGVLTAEDLVGWAHRARGLGVRGAGKTEGVVE
jgi:Zn-dependent protease